MICEDGVLLQRQASTARATFASKVFPTAEFTYPANPNSEASRLRWYQSLVPDMDMEVQDMVRIMDPRQEITAVEMLDAN